MENNNKKKKQEKKTKENRNRFALQTDKHVHIVYNITSTKKKKQNRNNFSRRKRGKFFTLFLFVNPILIIYNIRTLTIFLHTYTYIENFIQMGVTYLLYKFSVFFSRSFGPRRGCCLDVVQDQSIDE